MSPDHPTTLTQHLTPSDADGAVVYPVVSRYEVLGPAGRGGMGVVYKARHVELDRLVALKVTLPGVSVERFKREARLLARVPSPRVVAVHDFEELPDGRHLLVMEWVDGPDLATRLRAGPLGEPEALPIMRAVAEGMGAAAAAGITHRDLKPSNILLDARGARVCDFGLASSADHAQTVITSPGQLMGTAHYMAPEQAESPRMADTRADIYSYGATFYHALCGEPPFTAGSLLGVLYKHKTAPLTAPQSLAPHLSDRTAAVVKRCLAKEPADRFQSFAEVLRHIQPEPAADDPWPGDLDPELADHLARYRTRRPVYVADRYGIHGAEVYPFPGGRTLTVVAGNITEQRVDAVVSPDNDHLTMSSGAAEAIRYAAGLALEQAVVKLAPVRRGQVVVTPGGQLRARYVFHAVTAAFDTPTRHPRPLPDDPPTGRLVEELLAGCVAQADRLGVESLAMPLLGTGAGTFPAGDCLDATFRFWASTLLRGATSLWDVRIVLLR